MKHVINKAIVSLAVMSAGFIPAQAGAAGSASFVLSPNNANKAVNSTFTVAIYENSGAETVNSVQADLTYDANQLQYVGFSAGAFSCPIVNVGGGMMSIGCANFSGAVSGNQLVGSISFKAIANGNTTISMNQSSIIARSTDATDIWNHGSVTGTMTTYTPAAQPAVKKTTTATPVATTPVVTETPKEEVKAETTKAEESAPVTLPAATEEDNASVWAYLAVFLGATAVAAGIVYRDNLKKWMQNARGAMGAKTAPVAAVAGASAAKKTAAKKAVAKKKPAAKKK
ncbi:MAG: cohesin domain-containing protein [Candidatus Saccharibacteria bacterium]|nr:cohesin domain-containing protein [Candidatus Saccharibacteria bacterium]